MEDLHKHTQLMEKERLESYYKKRNIMRNTNQNEVNQYYEDLWQERILAAHKSQVQNYSTKFNLDPNLSDQEKELARLKFKIIDDPYSYH